jgi:hypothetical protein
MGKITIINENMGKITIINENTGKITIITYFIEIMQNLYV